MIELSVWPDQPQQDRGTVYSCCKPHTRGAKHQHRWHADGTCRQLQVGRIISNDGYLEEEIKSRISKASQALGRLRTKVLNHHNICLFTKLKVYRAVILTFQAFSCGMDARLGYCTAAMSVHFQTLNFQTGFAEPPAMIRRWSHNTQSSSDTNDNLRNDLVVQQYAGYAKHTKNF